jgi:FkbM family methyltransferase
MNLVRRFKNKALRVSPLQLRNRRAEQYGKLSYSQCGEDLIVEFILRYKLKIDKPSYMDLGAHHPWHLSNTARFYALGCRGINVEPDPDLIGRFAQDRGEDINLNCGVSSAAGNLDFYVMDPPTLNTFSRSEAERYEQSGHRIVRTLPIPVVPLGHIVRDHAHGVFPDFLTIDVEGLEQEILGSTDFTAGPKVICLETLEYARDGTGRKREDIMATVHSLGYELYADTLINSIYIRRDLWRRVPGIQS